MITSRKKQSYRWGTALLFISSSCLLSAVVVAAPDDGAPPPVPGKLVDIGGRRLHLHCTGSGSPVVIVENGGGGFSIDFALVQPQVAKVTQICTYDRAGCAWSEAGPTQWGTIEQTMDDLHLLLRKAEIRPPYVFVGASLGGICVRAYQRRYPDEVVGLVLDDPTSDEGLGYRVNGKDKPIYEMTAADMREVAKDVARNPPPPPELPTRLDEPLDRLPRSLQAARLWASRKLLAERVVSQLAITDESWRQEFIALRRERLRQAHALGSLPLIVLGRNQSDMARRQKELGGLTALSSTGKLVIAKNSGHAIQLYQPDLVVQAIREVVTAARAKRAGHEAP
jgi:pimeloyl-ACP methyl ester carboxylesterase